MCGIFAYIGNNNNAPQRVLSALQTLEYRGYDSWGVAASRKHNIIIKKQAGKIGSSSVTELSPSSFAFGHTRWATHGGVTQANAHPHADCTGKRGIVHNGIVENYEQLKKKLIKQGHIFISQTDSEVIIHLVEEYAKTKHITDAVRLTFQSLQGSNAIIVMDEASHTFIAARNGSPLVVGYGQGENFLSSDTAALLPYTKSVTYLESGQMVVMSSDSVSFLDISTNTPALPKKEHVTWSLDQAQLGRFHDFTLKEIFEQPDVITRIIQSSDNQILTLAGAIKKSYGTYMVGCGSASYACIAGSYLFSKIAKRHINWAVGSEFGYELDFLTPKSLVIALSQSGETMDTLESVTKSKQKGAKIAAIVNVVGSSLFREAEMTIQINAGPEQSVASTKAVTGKLAILTLLAYAISGDLLLGKKRLMKAVRSVKNVLSRSGINRISSIAQKVLQAHHIYVIGRGLSYPASLETALKIKEISYIHAEGMAAGELKHGPLALVEKGVPCIAFLPDDETYGANLAGAMEMKARGGFIIGISYKQHEVFDEYIHVGNAEEATIIPNIVVGQLLAYYLTLGKNLDPDKPRNLAKSVTVK